MATREKASALTWIMRALIASVAALATYLLLIFADGFTSAGALAPQVNADLTIQASQAVPVLPLITAAYVATLASILAAISGYFWGRSLSNRGQQNTSFSLILGPSIAALVIVLTGAYLEPLPGWSLPWWTGIFPEHDFWLPAVMVMLIPALAATIAMNIGFRTRTSSRAPS